MLKDRKTNVCAGNKHTIAHSIRTNNNKKTNKTKLIRIQRINLQNKKAKNKHKKNQ